MKPSIATTEPTASVFVYLAPLPDGEPTAPVFPPARWQSICECKSERVRREKYHVWKLLEYALRDRYGKELKDLQFSCANGKWACDLCHFSLSHSHGVLGVAVSDFPVGIDVEKITEPTDALMRKLFTEDELQRYHGMPKSKKTEFFTRLWTRKESLFKQAGGAGFFTTEASGYTQETVHSFHGENYVLSVATDPAFEVHIIHIPR